MFDSVKVFSASMVKDRRQLGDRITDWLKRNNKIEIVDKMVVQSSDSAYHCVSIILFYKEKRRAKANGK